MHILLALTTRFPKIPKDQITPLVAELLELIQLQMEEIQLLRDEIARLKNQKPRVLLNNIFVMQNDKSIRFVEGFF
jgi:hypothetical protein